MNHTTKVTIILLLCIYILVSIGHNKKQSMKDFLIIDIKFWSPLILYMSPLHIYNIIKNVVSIHEDDEVNKSSHSVIFFLCFFPFNGHSFWWFLRMELNYVDAYTYTYQKKKCKRKAFILIVWWLLLITSS